MSNVRLAIPADILATKSEAVAPIYKLATMVSANAISAPVVIAPVANPPNTVAVPNVKIETADVATPTADALLFQKLLVYLTLLLLYYMDMNILNNVQLQANDKIFHQI